MNKILTISFIGLSLLACNPILHKSKKLQSTTERGVKFTNNALMRVQDGLPNIGDTLEIVYSGNYISGKPFFEGEKIVQMIKGDEDNSAGINSLLKDLYRNEPVNALIPDRLHKGSVINLEYSDTAYYYNLTINSVKQRSYDLFESAKPIGDTVVINNYTKYVVLKQGSGKPLKKGDKVFYKNTIILEDEVVLNSNHENGSTQHFQVGGRPSLFTHNDKVLPKLSEGSVVKLIVEDGEGFGPDFKKGIYGRDYTITSIIEVDYIERVPELVPFDVAGKDTLEAEGGLKYIIVEEGHGEYPKEGESVEVHYTGYHLSGDYFDSSILRNSTFKFNLGTPGIIKGWNIAVAKMKKGSKHRIIIPYQLGYGESGKPPVIAPKETLIFDIELIEQELHLHPHNHPHGHGHPHNH